MAATDYIKYVLDPRDPNKNMLRTGYFSYTKPANSSTITITKKSNGDSDNYYSVSGKTIYPLCIGNSLMQVWLYGNSQNVINVYTCVDNNLPNTQSIGIPYIGKYNGTHINCGMIFAGHISFYVMDSATYGSGYIRITILV